MILVRNVFRLKFGHTKEAVGIWKEMIALAGELHFGARDIRLLTDAVGPFYTLVFEATFDNLGHFEQSVKDIMSKPQWGEVYQRFTGHVESGHREILNIVSFATIKPS